MYEKKPDNLGSQTNAKTQAFCLSGSKKKRLQQGNRGPGLWELLGASRRLLLPSLSVQKPVMKSKGFTWNLTHHFLLSCLLWQHRSTMHRLCKILLLANGVKWVECTCTCHVLRMRDANSTGSGEAGTWLFNLVTQGIHPLNVAPNVTPYWAKPSIDYCSCFNRIDLRFEKSKSSAQGTKDNGWIWTHRRVSS